MDLVSHGKKEGTETLVLVTSRLIKYDGGREEWREVETYRSDIVVDVSTIDQIKSLDWKWIIGILVTMLLIPAFWRWIDRKKKDSPDEKSNQTNDQKKKPVSKKRAK